MKTYRFIICLFTIFMIIQTGCDKSVGPEKYSSASIVQIPGCKTTGLSKNSNQTDSCFTYQFHDVLIVDFCAAGNCCPDSNRFSIKDAISNDTITVVIADTAAHLCRCLCTYILHGEFFDLPFDNYLFLVKREDYSSQAILYSVNVRRN